eukprot:TRINITY_DN12804_c0_g2_i2.p1 TRINITY_DN12804_c0_g2~~TRINITY_DN12804_c0_g2_i2.p1  ORF type:complete len:258 (-),score=53.72 TRINITY_DN12804_c0_g2_i2:195-968(-)
MVRNGWRETTVRHPTVCHSPRLDGEIGWIPSHYCTRQDTTTSTSLGEQLLSFLDVYEQTGEILIPDTLPRAIYSNSREEASVADVVKWGKRDDILLPDYQIYKPVSEDSSKNINYLHWDGKGLKEGSVVDPKDGYGLALGGQVSIGQVPIHVPSSSRQEDSNHIVEQTTQSTPQSKLPPQPKPQPILRSMVQQTGQSNHIPFLPMDYSIPAPLEETVSHQEQVVNQTRKDSTKTLKQKIVSKKASGVELKYLKNNTF